MEQPEAVHTQDRGYIPVPGGLVVVEDYYWLGRSLAAVQYAPELGMCGLADDSAAWPG